MSPAGEGCSGVDLVEGVLLPVSCVCVCVRSCVCVHECVIRPTAPGVFETEPQCLQHSPQSFIFPLCVRTCWFPFICPSGKWWSSFSQDFFFSSLNQVFNLFEILCSTPISPNRHSCKREKIVFFLFFTLLFVCNNPRFVCIFVFSTWWTFRPVFTALSDMNESESFPTDAHFCHRDIKYRKKYSWCVKITRLKTGLKMTTH